MRPWRRIVSRRPIPLRRRRNFHPVHQILLRSDERSTMSMDLQGECNAILHTCMFLPTHQGNWGHWESCWTFALLTYYVCVDENRRDATQRKLRWRGVVSKKHGYHLVAKPIKTVTCNTETFFFDGPSLSTAYIMMLVGCRHGTEVRILTGPAWFWPLVFPSERTCPSHFASSKAFSSVCLSQVLILILPLL